MYKKRYELIDSFRGAAFISMAAYHSYWDLIYLFGQTNPLSDTQALIWQKSIEFSFILLSGFSSGLGSHTRQHGIVVFLCGLLVTIVSLFLGSSSLVLFGVLTFLGTSMILTSFIKKRDLDYPSLGILWLFLFILSYTLKDRSLNLVFVQVSLPKALYSFSVRKGGITAIFGYLLSYIGLEQPGFYSSDYVPLIPWLFLFLLGRSLYALFREKSWLVYLKKGCRPLSFLGRHSLILYLFHQPILFLILSFLFA